MMNFVEKTVLKFIQKKEWKKVPSSNNKSKKYEFLELFVVLFKQITHISIIDRKVLEDVLSRYCDMPEFKSLFSDVKVNEYDKIISFGDSFITANTSGLLNIQDSKNERYFIGVLDDNQTGRIMCKYDKDKIFQMTELIRIIYSEYIMELEYPEVKITDATIRYVLEHPERHMNCPVRVFTAKFYTDEEWEKRSNELLSNGLPGDEKPPVKKLIRFNNK